MENFSKAIEIVGKSENFRKYIKMIDRQAEIAGEKIEFFAYEIVDHFYEKIDIMVAESPFGGILSTFLRDNDKIFYQNVINFLVNQEGMDPDELMKNSDTWLQRG